MTRVFVVTDNEYLGQKIRLALLGKCLVSVGKKAEAGFDVCLWDIDFCNAENTSGVITMSHSLPCDLPIPFTFSALFSLFSADAPSLSLNGRTCYIRNEEIKLTELEAALLSLLISAEGEYVSREEILEKIWDSGTECGIINVYIHYLREKIEKGEKIILSSRRHGYCIDKKYLGGEKNA